MSFPIHNVHNAPEESRATLEQVDKTFGFVPNVLGLLAESPAALQGYLSAMAAFDKSDLTPAERQVVLLSASLENSCAYCVAAHSMSVKMAGTPDVVLDALRRGAPLPDGRLEALSRFTRTVIQQRGWVSAEDVEVFRREGFAERHVLEVLLGIALKTLSNYTNHVAHPPLDEAFWLYAWTDRTETDVTKPACCAV